MITDKQQKEVMIMLTDEQVKIWIEKFDSNDSTDLLTDILNNKVKLELF